MKRIVIAIVGLFITFATNISSSQIPKEDVNIAYAKIDGFEKPGEWQVHYSTYRSLNWEGEGSTYESNDKWIKWITADDSKVNFERKYVVPPGVYRSPLLQNEKTILSVKARWDYKGLNWLTISPSNRRLAEQQFGDEDVIEKKYQKDKLSYANYILLPGRVLEIYCYFWGKGYNYTVEAQVQDYEGNTHILPAGYLNFYGWQNVTFRVPKYIKQENRHLPWIRPIRFLRFKIIATPQETSEGFYTYLDYLHTRSDISDRTFFGNRLRREDIYWEDPKEVKPDNK